MPQIIFAVVFAVAMLALLIVIAAPGASWTPRRWIMLALAVIGVYVFFPGRCHNAARAEWHGPADPALHAWFDSLASGKGLCCSFADGVSIQDVDWDTALVATAAGASEVRFRVRLNGIWFPVPAEAVVTEPNKFGPAVVWPYQDMNGVTQIRCFLPGAGA